MFKENFKKNIYVIKEKTTGLYEYEDGNMTNDIFEATKYLNYKEVHSLLWDTFDEPSDFEIMRCSMEIKIEELM